MNEQVTPIITGPRNGEQARCEMQTAETLLAIYGERGRHGNHIRKLSDLKVKGQREKPTWLKVMSAMRRRTLIVCERCHVAIHAGRPTRTHEDQEEPIKG